MKPIPSGIWTNQKSSSYGRGTGTSGQSPHSRWEKLCEKTWIVFYECFGILLSLRTTRSRTARIEDNASGIGVEHS